MSVIKYLKSMNPKAFVEKLLAEAKKSPSACYSVVIMRPKSSRTVFENGLSTPRASCNASARCNGVSDSQRSG